MIFLFDYHRVEKNRIEIVRLAVEMSPNDENLDSSIKFDQRRCVVRRIDSNRFIFDTILVLQSEEKHGETKISIKINSRQ